MDMNTYMWISVNIAAWAIVGLVWGNMISRLEDEKGIYRVRTVMGYLTVAFMIGTFTIFRYGLHLTGISIHNILWIGAFSFIFAYMTSPHFRIIFADILKRMKYTESISIAKGGEAYGNSSQFTA